MNITHIKVEYPSSIKKVIKTEAQMREMGYKNYKGDKVSNVFVNRTQIIKVRRVERLVKEEFMELSEYEQELDDMCVAQTGMTRSQYQVKNGKAWNE